MIYNFDELTFQILRIDLFKHKAGVFEVKPRPYAALSYRVSGSGCFEILGQSFVSRPGDVCFIPAHTPYKVEYSISESIVVEMPECNYTAAENHTASPEISALFKALLEIWNEEHSVNRAKSAIYGILDRMSSDKRAVIKTGRWNRSGKGSTSCTTTATKRRRRWNSTAAGRADSGWPTGRIR